MSFCEKCGAYIPMDETACPACGYDAEAERKARETQAEEQRKREEKQQYQYAGAQQQEYSYGQQTGQHSTYEQSREEKKTTGTGTAHNKDWQWNGGQRPLWEDPNAPKTSYEDYAQKAREWASDSVNNRYLSILSYIGPLFVVPLLLRKGDPFARHHANQGLVLFLFSAVLSLIEEFVPFGGLVNTVGGFFALVCMVKGILSVVNGRMDKLPLLGDVRLLK